MKINNKAKGWILFSTTAILMAIAAWVVGMVVFADGQWLYEHTKLICTLLGVTVCLVVFDGVVAWNYEEKIAVLTTTALIAVTAATASAGNKDKSSGITTGQTNPYGNASVARPTWPYGWLFYGWGSVWDFLRDGLDSWQSGHPVITIDPQPPASDDTSSQ